MSFEDLVRWFGVPGAMMAVVIYAMTRGLIISAREVAKDEAHNADVIAEWKSRYAKMETEKNFWRDEAMANNKQLGETTELAHRAVSKIRNNESGGQ